jgi:hypothetical protein
VSDAAGTVPDEAATHTLHRFPETLAVVGLPPGAEVPAWAESSSIFSVTATATETSIVCARRSVPRKVKQAGPFTAFEVAGPLDLALTGVLGSLLAPLAEAGISVFTISTFDTDWLLVPQERADDAGEAWRRRGHTVDQAVPVQQERSKR